MKNNIFKKDKEQPIAENPQFEADKVEEDSEKKKGFLAKFGAYCKEHRKQAAIVCVLCVFALNAAGIGGYNAVVGDATQGGDKTVTIVDKDTGEEKVVKADSKEAKEAEENGDVIKETTKSSNAAKATEKKSNSNKKSPATSNSGNKKPASSASSSGSSGGSHSSGGGSSSSGTKPTQHHHNKTAHYATKTTYEKRWVGSVAICNACGCENPTSDHLKLEVKNGGNGGTHAEEKYETVLVKTTYIDYYYCSTCGVRL